MSTVHTSAASLYRAILDAASTSWEDSEAVTLEAVRPGDPDEDSSNYCTAEFRGPWLDVKRAMLLEVPMHGPVRPHPAPATFAFQSNGARASFKINGNRTRLLAMAEQVRKHWALFGGGPLPADLVKPKAQRRVVEFKPAVLRIWADMIAEKQFSDAMECGDTLGAIYYPGAKGKPIVLAGPQPVAGLPDGIGSGLRGHDREWVVFHLASGLAIGKGGRSRKAAESDALQAVADAAEKRGPDALEKAIAAAPAADTAAAREDWRAAHGLIDPAALQSEPMPEPAEPEEAQPAAVAQSEELTDHAKAVVYAVHCKTAAIARKIAADALADGVRMRRSRSEPGFDAASMALRRSVAQAVRAARGGPADAEEVQRISALWADKPGASAELRARAENMRQGVRQGMQWPGTVQDAAADLTMARARVYDAAADAIDAPPGPDAAPAATVAPVAHAAPPVGVSAPPVTVSTDPDAAMMRKAADRAQVLADGIKAAAGDDPATMARMLKSEAARVKAAARGMPSDVAAGYLTTADMLEHAAELHADALAEVPDMARKAQPGMRVKATARRPVMARRSPLAQPWRMAPSVARRIGRQSRRGPARGRAAPRMRPQAAAPPVRVCAAPVGESGQRFN